jgi:hypothetical protein
MTTTVTKTVRQTKKAKKTTKVRVSLYLDPEVLAYYKDHSGERGYQALINETLRRAMPSNGQMTRTQRIRAIRGKYAHVQTSSEEFALRKQQEIELEG